MEKETKKDNISIYVSNKTSEVLLYHEDTQEVETDTTKFFSRKYMLEVFDAGWEKVGSL